MTELAKRAVMSMFTASRSSVVEMETHDARPQMASQDELMALCKADLSAFCPATRH